MKPLPKLNAETRPFWDGCKIGELRYQFCPGCEKAQFPPRSSCGQCHGAGFEWRVSAGRGTVHSHTTVERAPTADFKPDTPYVIALVDLDENFRLMLNIRGDDALETAIGDRVGISFESTAEQDIFLPQAKRL